MVWDVRYKVSGVWCEVSGRYWCPSLARGLVNIFRAPEYGAVIYSSYTHTQGINSGSFKFQDHFASHFITEPIYF